VRPTTTAEVEETVKWCAVKRVPIITRGAGTSLSGGSTAVDGAITLSTEKMRTMRIDRATRTAVVQPGLYNAEVKAAAAAEGLWYPPDPRCGRGGAVRGGRRDLDCATNRRLGGQLAGSRR